MDAARVDVAVVGTLPMLIILSSLASRSGWWVAIAVEMPIGSIMWLVAHRMPKLHPELFMITGDVG